MRVLLVRHGYSVVTAGSGERAVEIAETEDVDLILMDIDLGAGRLDGTQAAQRILSNREVPIVFLKSHSEQEMVDRVRGITRYGYVLKDSGEFVLLQSIETAFELFEARDALQSENEDRRQIEEQSRRRNHFIQTILDDLPIGLAVGYIDDGMAAYMNKQFESIYGWPAAVIEDIKTFLERVYPDEAYRDEVPERIYSDISSGDPARH